MHELRGAGHKNSRSGKAACCAADRYAVTNTGLSVNGSALINIDSFWHDGEKQYATGTILPQNGVTAYLAMVRP